MSTINLQSPTVSDQQTITAYLYDPETLTPFSIEHPHHARKYTFPVKNLSVHHTPLFERLFILVSKKDRDSLPDLYKRVGWTRLLKAHYFLFSQEDCPDDFPAEERETKNRNLERSLSILRKTHPLLNKKKSCCFALLMTFQTDWTVSAAELVMKEEVTTLCQSYLGYFYDSEIGSSLDIANAAMSHHLAVRQDLAISSFFLANHYYRQGLLSIAIPLYKKVAKAGYTIAQSRLGYIYLSQSNTDKTCLPDALKWNKLAADQGDRMGQNNLAFLYESSDDTSINPDQSEPLYKLSADQGYIPAQYNLALLYIKHDRPNEAIKYLEMAAKRFNIDSIIQLAYCYQFGIGTEINYDKAVALYRLGASKNNPRSLNNLGFCYQAGIGVDKDLAQAIELYQRAMAQDLPAAFYNYAHLLHHGLGVPKNIPEAFSRYKKAADNHDKPAQYMVATLLYYSSGEIPQDLPESIRYFKMYYEGEQIDHNAPIKLSNLQKLDYSRNDFLNSSRHIPAHRLSLYLQAHLYLVKGPFLPYINQSNTQNMDARKIKEIYELLFSDMDRAWDLLPEETLRDFIYQLSGLIERVYNFNPQNNAADEKEIAESYLKDLKLPAKKTTLRQRKKPIKRSPLTPSLNQNASPIEAPQPHQIEAPSVSLNSNPDHMSAIKKSASKNTKKGLKKHQIPKTDNFETYRANIQRVLNDLKKRENEMKHFYLNHCDGQIRKLMQTLFDKDDMSFSETNRLITYLAETYKGEARPGSKTGGMLILKIGDLTTGGHAPHGGKTIVDRGALSDLRQLLASLYVRIKAKQS